MGIGSEAEETDDHGVKEDVGRRAASETRTSNATVIHEDSIDEPPAAKKGAVKPVSGITRVSPPKTTKSCKAKEKDKPVASSFQKPSRTPIAARNPRWIRIRYINNRANIPVSPSSSAKEDKMKSEFARGTS